MKKTDMIDYIQQRAIEAWERYTMVEKYANRGNATEEAYRSARQTWVILDVLCVELGIRPDYKDVETV